MEKVNVEFKLKFLLKSTTLKVNSIESISDDKTVESFRLRNKDSKMFTGFCSKIDKMTYFPIVGVPLSENTQHTVIFCEVAVGNSLFVKNNTFNVKFPADSLIVSDSCNGDFLNESADLSSMSYLIRDKLKILPLYKINFEYDPKQEVLKNKNLCNGCEENKAVMFCHAELSSLCAKCDNEIHSHKLTKNHSRVYYKDVNQNKFIYCDTHLKAIDFFCTDCLTPLCVDCRILKTGSHFGKDKHNMLNFLDACIFVREQTNLNSNFILNQQNKINEDILYFKERVEKFKENVLNMKKQLKDLFDTLNYRLEVAESVERQRINAELVNKLYLREIATLKHLYGERDSADLLKECGIILNDRAELFFDKPRYFDIPKLELYGNLTLNQPESVTARNLSNITEDTSVALNIRTNSIENTNK